MSTRTLQQTIPGVETSDGAGVKLRRSIGARPGLWLDPFLMLDEFGTENPDDYIAGFPPHPHRGFETVTYMIEGRMQHRDHLGNVGELESGGVQWMTAGRGIVHSEMPLQQSGRMRGFQLWINLAAAEKMKPAAYRDLAPDEIPLRALPGGGAARVIAGTLQVESANGPERVPGPINPVPGSMTTDPLYLDLQLPAGARFAHPVAPGYNAFVYVYEGSLSIDSRDLPRFAAGVLSDGDRVELQAGGDGCRAVLLSARPLREPVVQYGPFVMNTREEIEQALMDYRDGRLA